jgi:hypothetical protein
MAITWSTYVSLPSGRLSAPSAVQTLPRNRKLTTTFYSIRTLLTFVAPLLIPKAIAFYRSVRAPPPGRGGAAAIRPVPVEISYALGLLFAVALFFFARTLPYYSPENVFIATQSRLKAPVDVVFRRLATLRPDGFLTPRDEALRAHLAGLESRLLYLQYGPSVLADCPFCNADYPKSFFYYALPGLLVSHVLNLLVLAAVTSPLIAGRDATRWRKPATLAAIAVCLIDVYAVSAYNVVANARANRLGELDNFFWNVRVYRYTALAALNGVLGWVMWLAATNRAFVQPPSPAQRVDAAARALAVAKSRLNAVGVVKNTSLRDDALRDRSMVYWSHEVRLTSEAMEEKEVVDSIKDALEHRINTDALARDAEKYTRVMMESMLASTPTS